MLVFFGNARFKTILLILIKCLFVYVFVFGIVTPEIDATRVARYVEHNNTLHIFQRYFRAIAFEQHFLLQILVCALHELFAAE